VFHSRVSPWTQFRAGEDPADVPPVVNIRLERQVFERARSTTVTQQGSTATFYLDCFGYGASKANSEGGHDNADEIAEAAALRCAALVRQILMSGQYIKLGMRGTVGDRWITDEQVFKPADENHAAVQHVMAVRLTLEVQFNEATPEATGAVMESIGFVFERRDSGEVIATADYQTPPP
jgi:hypothetical protein